METNQIFNQRWKNDIVVSTQCTTYHGTRSNRKKTTWILHRSNFIEFSLYGIEMMNVIMHVPFAKYFLFFWTSFWCASIFTLLVCAIVTQIDRKISAVHIKHKISTKKKKIRVLHASTHIMNSIGKFLILIFPFTMFIFTAIKTFWILCLFHVPRCDIK